MLWSSHVWRLLLLLLACCCAVASSPSPALAADRLAIESVVAGFDGVYKAGFWTQFVLRLKAGPEGAQGRLDLLTEDGDGVPVIYPADDSGVIDLAANATTTVRLYAKAGPQRSEWHLQLRRPDEDQVLWSQRLNISPPQKATRELLVTIGPDQGIAAAVNLVKRPEEVSFLLAGVKQANELPDRVWGYEGVERILLIASPAGIADDLTPPQIEALEKWVLLGGKLILSMGTKAPELLAPTRPFSKFAPGNFESLDSLREVTGLANYSGAEFPRRLLADDRRPAVVKLAKNTARVELEQGGQAGNPPLILRQMQGFGQVTFIALELDHPTLLEWKGHSRFVARVLQLGGPAADNLAAARSNSITHLGYDDLVGQLRAVLDQFPGVTVVSFTAVAMVAILLLLLIGPADYFVINYLNLPRTITWVTFPLVCLAFCLGTWLLGRSAHGNLTRINQVEVVDIDISQNLVRGTLWTHLYSPHARSAQLSLRVQGSGELWQEVQGVADWQGLPGAGLGGLASPQVALDASTPYLISPPGRISVIDGLPLRTASSKALSARWWGKATFTPDLTPLRYNTYGHLAGELTNPLPIKLSDCLLASGEWLYRLEALEPGQKLQLSSLTALNLESRLQRRQVIDTKDLSTPWNPTDTDLTRIMHMLMLHDAVHGPKYTGMSHRFQPQIDLSQHVRSGRAVLMGRAESPTASLPLEGLRADELQAQTWTWYRLVWPVQDRETDTTTASSKSLSP
ncbi:hypothetical protein ETAA8_63290 [Anatilimnocola aggregata]|uniref:DUF4350 domain-containing protein n=1 Tax=Anatilimnocola aggregata TaxID=2528021 RepID=A0A517YLT1_9BACT|nr:hypothetical protein [Anatilimnocola aggregata]QDU31176.1 hypothetical protein ETAA8_63290 [Anatilimnocola aggregata]